MSVPFCWCGPRVRMPDDLELDAGDGHSFARVGLGNRHLSGLHDRAARIDLLEHIAARRHVEEEEAAVAPHVAPEVPLPWRGRSVRLRGRCALRRGPGRRAFVRGTQRQALAVDEGPAL